jgi:DNA (cytosine-5)-methyltransferase 1
MEWLQCADLTQYDLIHASPPCQRYSVMTPKEAKDAHPDLLPDVLGRLRKQDTPYIVENVAGTQHLMQNPIFLCGTMFGLDIWRHRWFEIGGVPGVFFLLPPCAHVGSPILVSGRGMRGVTKGGKRPSEPLKATKMQGIQIDWMITKELDEAIPPAYSRFLAEQVKAAAVTR